VGFFTLWAVLLTVGYLVLGKRMFELIKRLMNPMAIAFSTTSSEAVFPKMVEELEAYGCNNKIVSFILPLVYSFNLDGSMMYMTFASFVHCTSLSCAHRFPYTAHNVIGANVNQ
jgi:Na+/H+-dicarboxylate symporter